MVEMLKVDSILPNVWNPNRMSAEAYGALVQEMQEKGPSAIDPIKVSPKEKFYAEQSDMDPELLIGSEKYVMVDGEHRWKAAFKLGWAEIPAEVLAITEAEAIEVNYRKNRERGQIDPLLEAQLFEKLKENGATDEDIGKKFGVDRSFVSRSRSLIKLPETVIKLYKEPETFVKVRESAEREARKLALQDEVNRWTDSYLRMYGKKPTEKETKDHVDQVSSWGQYTQDIEIGPPEINLTKSHLEALMGLSTKDAQVKMALNAMDGGWTVGKLEEQAQSYNKRWFIEEKFKAALAQATLKKCPKCGADPQREVEINAKGQTWFKCSNWNCYESWHIDDTKLAYQAKVKKKKDADEKERLDEREKLGLDSTKEAPRASTFIRTALTSAELDERIGGYVARMLPKVVKVRKITLRGDLADGKAVNLEMDEMGAGHRFSLEIGGKRGEYGYVEDRELDFSIGYEQKIWSSMPDLHARVDGFSMPSEEANLAILKRFIEETVLTEDLPPKWIKAKEKQKIPDEAEPEQDALEGEGQAAAEGEAQDKEEQKTTEQMKQEEYYETPSDPDYDDGQDLDEDDEDLDDEDLDEEA